eukprot:scaffold1440_cov114-Isochrysis_galbana.AAC.5
MGQHHAHNLLESTQLEHGDAVPRDDATPTSFGPKHILPQLVRALLPRLLKREAALGVVCLEHEQQRLAARLARFDLTQAVT